MTADQRNYRLGDEAEQRRLDELTDRGHESVADLTHEIGMCRFLIERASASPALCNALLSTCAKLCVSHQLAMPEPITYEEFRRMLCNMLANALDRQLSLRKASRWVCEYIRPGKTRRSVYGLKHDLDHWYQRHGTACYLRESDFADVLRRCGHVVKNGCVRIGEVTA